MFRTAWIVFAVSGPVFGVRLPSTSRRAVYVGMVVLLLAGIPLVREPALPVNL